MKIYRPLWNEGAFLSPQQFQQQSRWEAYTNDRIARLYTAHPWGVVEAQFDNDALTIGRVHCQQLILRLPDGTMIDTDLADDLPPTRDIHEYDVGTRQALTIYLSLPLLHANGENVHLDRSESESSSRLDKQRPRRFKQAWIAVQDLLGSETESLSVERHHLSLRFDGEEHAAYVSCPIGRLVRDGQGPWYYASDFIPPLMAFSASKLLCDQLAQLVTQLSAKRARLMNMRRESNERMADFAVADVSLFWLLNALNTHQSVLTDFVANPTVHPELIYRELARLAGALLTFSLTHEIDSIPTYQHESPEAVFFPLFALIRELLDASLPSRVIALEMERITPNQWRVPLHDDRLKTAADFYLSVRSTLPAHQLMSLFPQLCKVGSPDEVNNLINVALVGIPLIALTHVPAAIPLRLENHYFSLDLTHPSARAMMDSGYCAFYVPSTLPDIQLELFAVLRNE
ncbi:type VI secretion system baseplate subunit TssK [Thorsellia anophelis]|uniref:Type VI secretion system protein ImpJ n=1 Tax=Thorsellia anophelis DSM 18579 TaxID=1123402 RepID=A0A1I0FAV6_9GAMM|nr:type VI secretion system baseplate subunit TssK [Thorsellia anophelis]SET55268.1 type VI secretion system protein ImpJ [Thorsellia anophelis DSM 18579]